MQTNQKFVCLQTKLPIILLFFNIIKVVIRGDWRSHIPYKSSNYFFNIFIKSYAW